MADAAQEERWTHTAHILAVLANVNRAKDVAAMSPVDFMPKRFQPPPSPLPDAPVSVLRDLFVKPRPPGSPALPAS